MKFISNEFTVPTDLQPYIGGVWYISFEGPASERSSVQCCLPTGMAELIFHLTPPRHTVQWEGEWTVFPTAFLVGVQTTPAFWHTPGGTIMMGVSIKPEAFAALYSQPIGSLADQYVDATDFFKGEIDRLIERLCDTTDLSERAHIIWAYFRHRLALRKQQEHRYFSEAVSYMRVGTGTHSVEKVCEQVFVGKRQLQRTFQEQIGVTPKTYGRIVRFKSAYDFVQRFPKATWADITYRFGYSDQAHFIRDFKQFTGDSPASFMTGFMPQSKLPFAFSA